MQFIYKAYANKLYGNHCGNKAFEFRYLPISCGPLCYKHGLTGPLRQWEKYAIMIWVWSLSSVFWEDGVSLNVQQHDMVPFEKIQVENTKDFIWFRRGILGCKNLHKIYTIQIKISLDALWENITYHHIQRNDIISSSWRLPYWHWMHWGLSNDSPQCL